MEKTVSNSISSSKHDFSYTCSVCKWTFSSVHFCMWPRKFVDLLNKKTKQPVTSDLSREEKMNYLVLPILNEYAVTILSKDIQLTDNVSVAIDKLHQKRITIITNYIPESELKEMREISKDTIIKLNDTVWNSMRFCSLIK